MRVCNVDAVMVEINSGTVITVAYAQEPRGKFRISSSTDVVCEGELLKVEP